MLTLVVVSSIYFSMCVFVTWLITPLIRPTKNTRSCKQELGNVSRNASSVLWDTSFLPSYSALNASSLRHRLSFTFLKRTKAAVLCLRQRCVDKISPQ